MADKLRNEISIDLAGETRTMRATFKTMRAIERDCKQSILAMVTQRFAQGEFGIDQAAYVIHHGLLGNEDERLSFDEVGEEIMKVGLSDIGMKVLDFLSLALEGTSLGKSELRQMAATLPN